MELGEEDVDGSLLQSIGWVDSIEEVIDGAIDVGDETNWVGGVAVWVEGGEFWLLWHRLDVEYDSEENH